MREAPVRTEPTYQEFLQREADGLPADTGTIFLASDRTKPD